MIVGKRAGKTSPNSPVTKKDDKNKIGVNINETLNSSTTARKETEYKD